MAFPFREKGESEKMALFSRGDILDAMLKKKDQQQQQQQKRREVNPSSDEDSSDESSESSEPDASRRKPLVKTAPLRPAPTQTAPPSISDLGIVLSYHDHKRNDFRSQHSTRIMCDMYKLENTDDRKHIPVIKPVAEGKHKRGEDEPDPMESNDAPSPVNFEQDLDYVSRLCRNQAIGFSLDDIMTALYGPVLKPSGSKASRRRNRKTGTPKEEDGEPEEAGEISNEPSVCYFKRLSQTAHYTGLSVARLVPVAESQYNKSEAYTMNAIAQQDRERKFDKTEADALKEMMNEARSVRRTIVANSRILPVHFLPQFLFTQRVSVQKANNIQSLCFNLLRDMERLSRAFSNNRLYLYTVQQLRANFNHIIWDINIRSITATEFMQQLGQWEVERQQLCEQFHRMGTTMGTIIDTLTVTEDDVKSVFIKQIAPKLASVIHEATEEISLAVSQLKTSRLAYVRDDDDDDVFGSRPPPSFHHNLKRKIVETEVFDGELELDQPKGKKQKHEAIEAPVPNSQQTAAHTTPSKPPPDQRAALPWNGSALVDAINDVDIELSSLDDDGDISGNNNNDEDPMDMEKTHSQQPTAAPGKPSTVALDEDDGESSDLEELD